MLLSLSGPILQLFYLCPNIVRARRNDRLCVREKPPFDIFIYDTLYNRRSECNIGDRDDFYTAK